ncbi:FANCI solenoid 4-domain-containing protein [Zychaea mexicana]|uniref:FANCI solenoid 4-domain-containing protein n=1 Tax=Zychaea mexicana TaxID=64656 RepID=UPI0022FE782C|nr:FANCI solenoid 4-domain-containing protein [Zychaea mexicana]KAI9499698.1 FANCI solenoid 4-domain-containing protein [Zychaea mexicana]
MNCRLSKDTDTTSSAKQAANVFNLLLPEVDTLESNMLSRFAYDIISFVEKQVQVQPRLFELLSKIWNVLSTTDAQADGVIEQLSKSDWNPQSAISIASAFNEMELSPIQLDKVCKRMILELGELDVEETPPFIYQLLLLSRKGMKKEVISGICKHFIALKKHASESAATPSFRRMEGTVMLHMSFAIKQDQDLGKELIKYVSNGKTVALETFPIACLLSAARIHRLEDTIFDILQKAIVNIYKDGEKLKQCAWISDFSRIDGNRLHQVMMEITENSAHGWDQLIQSLTQLAMLLIDHASTQSFVPGRPSSSSSPPPLPAIDKSKQGPLDCATLLGKDILSKMFELHRIVRSEILEQITARIVSHSPSTMHFLDILETIVAKDYYAIEPFIPNLRDTLDYLSLLPYVTAERLLTTIQPVASRNDQFRDGLMLVLRKSMFAKDLNGRMVSVNGFLALLSNVFSQQNSSNYSQGIAYEILGLLRRCFNQQAEIRATAYKGLATLSQHKDIAGDIFEILYAQFQRVYEKDRGMVTPIRLDVCVENSHNGGAPKIAEPIHILLSSLFQSLRNLEKCLNNTSNSVITDQVSKCRSDLASLVFRLSKSDLEDYELDKTADLDLATHTGMRNNIYAGLLQGTYEAAMEYEYFGPHESLESFQTILNLFKKRMDAAALLKEGSSNDKGRKSVAVQAEYSVSSLDFLTDVTRRMFTEGSVQRPIRALRGDIGYVQYIVLSIQTALKKTTLQGGIQERSFDRCTELGKLCLNILKSEDSDSSFVNHQAKKGHSVLESIWDTFRNICETVLQLWPDQIVTLFSRLTGSPMETVEGSHINTQVFNVVKIIEEIMTKYLSDRTPLYKEAANLMQVVVFLSKRMDRNAGGCDFRERTMHMTKWLESIIKERPIEDTALAKQIINLYIQLSAEINDFKPIVYLAQDLHTIHGDLDFDQPVTSGDEDEAQVQYMMINIKTCSPITLQLLSFMDQLNDDMIWGIGRLKLAASTDANNIHEFENAMCGRLIFHLNIMSEFTKAVLLGQHAENLIKTLIKTYKTLSTLIKYKLVSRPKEISDDFTMVVMAACTRVTDKMYRFLTVYGQHHEHNAAGASGTSTAKKRSKDGSNKKQSVHSKEKAKILRESKMIPKLIFEVEEFERHLIQLTRRSNKDLMQHMKRSTSRDFKINLNSIEAEPREESADEDDDRAAKEEAMQDYLAENRQEDNGEEEEGSIGDGGSGRASKRARVV